jgi:hypothetical protein
MGTPHKHREIIIAWANGEEVEYKHRGEWVSAEFPVWSNESEYRIKPKRIKKEGWVNVFQLGETSVRTVNGIYPTKEKAAEWGFKSITCIRIEWEEDA